MSLFDSAKSYANKFLLAIKHKLPKNQKTTLKYILGGFIVLVGLVGGSVAYYNSINSSTAKAVADCLAQNSAVINFAETTTPFNSNQLVNNINQCASSNISITKTTQEPKVFNIGTEYYYTIEFENTGTVDLKEVTISDQANSNIEFAGNTCETTLTDVNGSATLPFST
ncbi:MAG: hypothetical protein AAGF07_01690, partial [Patescibacteria group bacterium]